MRSGCVTRFQEIVGYQGLNKRHVRIPSHVLPFKYKNITCALLPTSIAFCRSPDSLAHLFHIGVQMLPGEKLKKRLS